MKDRLRTRDHGLGVSGDMSCHFRHRNRDHDRGVALMWVTSACGWDGVRPRRRRCLVRRRPGGGVMGVRATRAGGAQAGRRADGGSPPASAVSIDVHDLLYEVWVLVAQSSSRNSAGVTPACRGIEPRVPCLTVPWPVIGLGVSPGKSAENQRPSGIRRHEDPVSPPWRPSSASRSNIADTAAVV